MINWKTLPRERGIYQITTGSVTYVGLSDNIQLRVKQHLESSSCRSRIILDTKKPKVTVLELLPNSDDKTLALREWYWFYKLKRKGHIVVNDPKTLGKTKSGQYFPPKKSPKKTNFDPKVSLGCGVKIAGVATVIIGFFSLGYFATGAILRNTELTQPNPDNSPDIETDTNQERDLSREEEEDSVVNMRPMSACINPIQRGRSQSVVEVLQKQLQELGYYDGEVDGDYGPQTQEAVSKFQREHDLDVDGIVGCDTQTTINDALR
ncbi:peptidoglycan-binding protein [Euhalothece natronophila Z-M001]|uniref:Peptidoglycan-binding protein n=1 Tax=Euhalothece natronophila Z-M001 TaxID=522448 RepID=A0A5B8NQN1_9CHRO|nr:peptidoglycan-binding protein [Euhalothece natronophila]QDZ41326.1 peptidoglycan-binding protein [Euhalothece natronophila Z-M001]